MSATTELKSYPCPECAAPLTLDEQAKAVKCAYCGRRFEVRRTANAHAPMFQPAATRTAVVLTVIPLLLVTVASIGAALVNAKRSKGGVFGEHVQWVDRSDLPVVAHVNDDAVEDIIGRYRVIAGGALQTYVGAFDGVTLKRIWSSGVLGDDRNAPAIHFAVSGNRVLVTDDNLGARIFDLATGRPIATAALTDKAAEVCGTADGFWVATIDKKGVHVDRDGRVIAGAAACETHGAPHAPSELPSVSGFAPGNVLTDGKDAIAFGVRQPGSAVPMAVGFDATTRQVRYVRPLATIEPARVGDGSPAPVQISDGVAYAQYKLRGNGGYHLVAIDVRTGTTRWDVGIPRSNEGWEMEKMLVTSARLYVPHWAWLDVFDSKTGGLVGTIGKW